MMASTSSRESDGYDIIQTPPTKGEAAEAVATAASKEEGGESVTEVSLAAARAEKEQDEKKKFVNVGEVDADASNKKVDISLRRQDQQAKKDSDHNENSRGDCYKKESDGVVCNDRIPNNNSEREKREEENTTKIKTSPANESNNNKVSSTKFTSDQTATGNGSDGKMKPRAKKTILKGREIPIQSMTPSPSPSSQHSPSPSFSRQQQQFGRHNFPTSSSLSSSQSQRQQQNVSPSSQTSKCQPLNHRHYLPKPKSPSKCSLFCAFYAEFDIIVGPKICFQSPKQFMDQDMYVSTHVIHDLLKQTFDSLVPSPPTPSSEETSKTTAAAPDKKKKESLSLSRDSTKTATTADGDKGKQQHQPIKHHLDSSSDHDKTPNNQHCNNVEHSHTTSYTSSINMNNPSSLSIFDSTSEYIITGNEIANKMMCLSTHNMHILTRPTIIVDHSQYQRNSLLFSVGFVIRRVEDPRPYRPVLSKLASTFRDMEVESRFLSKKETRIRIQGILEDILVSLNSSSQGGGSSSGRGGRSSAAECNLLLDDANALNLKLFRTPRPPSSPVPDHVVPVLLRPEWQLHAYDWDLAINWIVPHVDGIKYARLIAQSSDVDIEIVRACLRVLKHHGVMAFVDIFRYSNVYESTPLASAMLAGKVPKLLNAAFYFASKTANRDISQGYAYPSSSNILDISISSHNQQQQQQQQPLSSSAPRSSCFPMPSQISTSASSFPPATTSIGVNTGSCSGAGGGSSSGGGGHSPVTTPPPSVLNSSAARREHRIMKVALAHIYCSCSRDTSFGDMLVGKVMQDVHNNHAAAGPSASQQHQQQMKKSENMAAEYSGNIPATARQHKPSGRPMHRQQQQQQQGRSHHLDNHPSSSKYDYSDLGGSLAASEAAVMTSPIFQGDDPSPSGGGGGEPSKNKKKDIRVDWSEAFDYFDHRRLVTFGIIYGLIKRVHSYPLAYDDGNAALTSDVDYPMGETTQGGGYSSSSQANSSGDHHKGSDSVGVDNLYGPGGGDEHRRYRHRHHHHLHHPTGTSPRLEPIHASPTTPSPPTPHQGTTLSGFQPESGGSGGGERDDRQQAKTIPSTGPGGTSISAMAPPPLTMPPPATAKQQQEAKNEELYKLAIAIAESMDGTKCDDELSCMYQMSLSELIELVKRIGKRGVMSISSTTTRHR